MEYVNKDNKSIVRTDKENRNSKGQVLFIDNRIQQKEIYNLNKAIQRSTVSAYSGGTGDDEIVKDADKFHLENGTGKRFHLPKRTTSKPSPNLQEREVKVPRGHHPIPDEKGTLHLFAHGNPTGFGELTPNELKTLIIDKLKPASVVFHSCFSTGGMEGYDPAKHGSIAGETARISKIATKGYSAPIKTIGGVDIIGLDDESLSMISDAQKTVILERINSATIKGVFFSKKTD